MIRCVLPVYALTAIAFELHSAPSSQQDTAISRFTGRQTADSAVADRDQVKSRDKQDEDKD